MESAKLIGIIVTILSAVITGTENRLLRRFRKAGALEDSRAISMDDIKVITRWRLDKLHSRKIINKSDTGLYYLDEVELNYQKSKRRKTALIIVSILFIATLIYFVLR